MRASEHHVYITDNGATYCGEHLGFTAKHTGRDISGQEILRVTPEMAMEHEGLFCETCGKKPPLLVEGVKDMVV